MGTFRKLGLITFLFLLTTGCNAMNDVKNPTLTIQTNHGAIEVELFEKEAPNTVANFLAYVEEGFYDGTIFHRVITNFMIQGGGFTEDMSQKKPNAPIENEANNGLKNDFGTLAMARTGDPHSATAQFFINTKDNDFLNFTSPTSQGWGYTVFGKVTKGLDVIEKIEAVATGNTGGHGDVPVEPVIMEKVTLNQ